MLSGCLSLSLFFDDPLSPLQTRPSDLNQPCVPVSPGSQRLGEEHACAQPQPDVHKLLPRVPAELMGCRGLRDMTGRESGSPLSEQEERGRFASWAPGGQAHEKGSQAPRAQMSH